METVRSSPNAVLDGFNGLVAREDVESMLLGCLCFSSLFSVYPLGNVLLFFNKRRTSKPVFAYISYILDPNDSTLLLHMLRKSIRVLPLVDLV